MRRIATFLAFAALTPAGGQADVPDLLSLTLPSVPTWCVTRSLSKEAAAGAANVDAAIAEATKTIDQSLQDQRVPSSGLPFVLSAGAETPATGGTANMPSSGSTPAPFFKIRVCVVVPANAPQPQLPLEPAPIAAGSFLALECKGGQDSDCIKLLRRRVEERSSADSAAAAATNPILLTFVPGDITPQSVAAAYVLAADRLTPSGVQITGTGSAADLTADHPSSRPLRLTAQTTVAVSGPPGTRRLVAAMQAP